MNAAIFTATRQIEISDIAMPVPSDSEVLIKVLGCGVCGTDAHIYAGEIESARPPVVLGHEVFGEVEEIGKAVQGLAVGDRVAVDPFVYCGYCRACRNGEYRFCSNEIFVGYHRNGGFAQYCVVPYGNAYRIPTTFSYEDAVLVETLSTVVAGFARLNPQPGRSALIIGAGTVGLLWNQLLRRSLSIVVIQSEPVAARLQRAAQLGADLVVAPQSEVLDAAVRELCPDGVDYIVDASGCTAAIAEALPLLKRGGTLMSFGICPKEERLSLSLNWFYRQQVSFLTSRRPPREMSRAIHLLEKRLVDSKMFVTGRYALEQIERTFELFTAGKDREIKMAIDPWQKEQQP